MSPSSSSSPFRPKRLIRTALAATLALTFLFAPSSVTAQGRSCEADSDCGGSIINRQVCADDTRVCIPASCLTNSQCSNADPTKFCSGLSCETKRGEGGSCRGALGGSDDAQCLPGFGCVSGTCRARTSTTSSASSSTTTSTTASSTSTSSRTTTTTSRSRTATATTTTESTTTSTPTSTQDSSKSGDSEDRGFPVLGLILGLGGAALAVLLAITFIARRRSRREADNDFSNSHMRPFAPTTFGGAAKPTAPPNMAMNAAPLPQKTTNEIIEYVEVHDSHEYPTAAAGGAAAAGGGPMMMQGGTMSPPPIVTVPANPVTIPVQQQMYDAYGNPVVPAQSYAPQPQQQYAYMDANGYAVDANGYPLDPNAAAAAGAGQVYYAGGTPPGSSTSPAGSGYYGGQQGAVMPTSPPGQAYIPAHQQHLFTGGQPQQGQQPSGPRPQGY